jgi:hypothetical protein
MSRTLFLMPSYTSSGLWPTNPYKEYSQSLDITKLGLSEELIDRMMRWGLLYDIMWDTREYKDYDKFMIETVTISLKLKEELKDTEIIIVNWRDG